MSPNTIEVDAYDFEQISNIHSQYDLTSNWSGQLLRDGRSVGYKLLKSEKLIFVIHDGLRDA